MIFNYNPTKFISNLNNIYFFSGLKKNKQIKRWFYYLYWTYLLHELSKNAKLYKVLCKWRLKKKINKYLKKKYIFDNNKYLFYKPFIKVYTKLSKKILKTYYKKKILLLKIDISYFFDILKKFLKKKNLINSTKPASTFFLLKKLKFLNYKIRNKNKKKWNKYARFFKGFRYYKLFVLKKKNRYKRNKIKWSFTKIDNSINNSILSLKLNTFSLGTYNVNWQTIVSICTMNAAHHSINTLEDVMFLLDKKINNLLNNWFGSSDNELDVLVKNKLIKLNSNFLVDLNYIIENGFMLTINNNDLSNYNFLFVEKKINFMFLVLHETNNKYKNYINKYLYLKLKKSYILHLLKNYENNLGPSKFIKILNYETFSTLRYINYLFRYNTDFLIFIKFVLDSFLKKKIKKKKLKLLKLNMFICSISNSIQLGTRLSNNYLIPSISKTFIKLINSSLILLGFYYIIKKKIIKLKLFKKKPKFLHLIKKIKIKNDFEMYLKFGIINILLFININKILRKVYLNYKYLLYFIYNNMKTEATIDNFYTTNFNIIKAKHFLKLTKKTKKIYNYVNKNYLISKKSRYNSKKKSYFSNNLVFTKFYTKKDTKQLVMLIMMSIIKYNYIYNNNILNYKSKILFFNLKNENSFNQMKFAWLKLFGLNKNLHFKKLKRIL